MALSSLLEKLKTEHETFDAARREIVALSAKAQNASKRAIFAVQRLDEPGAKALLSEAEEAIASIRSRATVNARLPHEGSFRAALEEYAEARFFAQLAWKGEVAAIDGLDEETMIGGLCDAVGEGVRLMILQVTAGQDDAAKEMKGRLDAVMVGLDAMDYSGYLRTKYDQARSHHRRAEDVLYELALRQR
jgi:predicted translin family RNA/ssDNA-binding protein